MKRFVTIPFNTTHIVYLSVFLLLLIGGCAGTSMVVSKDQWIPLIETGNISNNFKSNLLTLEYTYSRTENQMTISGKARISGGADSLDVRLLFLDPAGKIIKKKMIYSSGYRKGRANRIFDKTLTIPPTATGISFNYSSHARSSRR